MSFPENKTLKSIFDELANEQGLKDTSLLQETDYPKEIKITLIDNKRKVN